MIIESLDILETVKFKEQVRDYNRILGAAAFTPFKLETVAGNSDSH